MWRSKKRSLMCSFSLESLSWRNNIGNLSAKRQEWNMDLNLNTTSWPGVQLELPWRLSRRALAPTTKSIHPSHLCNTYLTNSELVIETSSHYFAGAAALLWLYDYLSWQHFKIQSVYANRDADAAITHTHTHKKWIYKRVKMMQGYNLLSAEQDAASQLDTHMQAQR